MYLLIMIHRLFFYHKCRLILLIIYFEIPHKRPIFVKEFKTIYLLLMAKNLLRFIIPLIAIIAIACGINRSESVVIEKYQADNLTTTIDASYTEISSIDIELFFPRQISSTNVLRLQNTGKRTNSTLKNNFSSYIYSQNENRRTKNLIKENSLTIHPLFIKPFHRMICLGKLII